MKRAYIMFATNVRLKIYGKMDEPAYYEFKTEKAARAFIAQKKKNLRRKHEDGFIDLMIDNFVVEHNGF